MQSLKVGQRIEMIRMGNDPNPILPGTKGTVTAVRPIGGEETQVSVRWDNGRGLMVLLPYDKVRVLKV